MKLYHGTNIEFAEIELDKCPPKRDFGRGFYLTSVQKHAEERAKDKVANEGGTKTVMEFDFDFDEIILVEPSLRIKRFDEVNEEWAKFVMYNRLRKEDEPIHEYDIVEGPVADDKMFRQFLRFSKNKLQLLQFIQKLKYPKEPTHQIAFCTERAVNLLIEYSEDFYTKLEKQITNLSVELIKDYNFPTTEAMKTVYDSDIFTQLSDETTKLYLKPWTEIYELLKQNIKK
ncbi:hypothetical protein FACS189429_0230 [Bacteroidia bacterium]|nr:hypothetical protein FACS189429_0230 [Bacteroidia bacterium]